MRMIRNIIEILLLFVLYDFLILNNSISDVEEINSSMYEEVYSSVISYESDAYILVFDYGFIADLVDEKYGKYNYDLIKISETSFILKVSVNSALYNKEINQKFYLRKGEMYEKFN